MSKDQELEQERREQRRINEDEFKHKDLSRNEDEDLPERPTGEMRPERTERSDE